MHNKISTFRRLNFSNPNVSVDGMATGVPNFTHNERVIDELTAFVTNYRQGPDVIFINDFE